MERHQQKGEKDIKKENRDSRFKAYCACTLLDSKFRQVAVVLVGLMVFLLSFSVSQAQAQSSYIIVHAVNPEGIEIASIEGVDPYCVEIYDGDTLIGHGISKEEDCNKPIAISPGTHTIKVKFNGMTKEQTVDLNSGETKMLVFTFSREIFDLTSYIYDCDLSSYISGSWNSATDEIWDIDQHPYTEWETNVRFCEPVSCGRYGTYEGKAKLQFSLVGVNYNWYAYAWYNMHAYCGEEDGCDCPPETPYWHADTFADSGTYSIPSQHEGFDYWYLQPDTITGDVEFYVGGNLLASKDTYLIPAVDDSSLRIVIGENFHVWGGAPATREDGGSGTFDVYMSSVPYDVTGTGIRCEEVQLPVASFTYSPENPEVGEEITFDASSSYDPDGTIVKHEWDFGDGNSAEGEVVTHAYSEAGEYTVTLTVTDNDGLTDSTQKKINVGAGVVIKSVTSKHTGKGRFAYFLDGVDFNETFKVEVDWGGHPPGITRFITPKGTYEEISGERTFNMGTDFGPNSRLAVEAVSADETKSEKVYANCLVMKNPDITWDFTSYDIGDNFYYKTNIELGMPLIDEGVGEGVIPEDIPYFGQNAFKFETLLSYEATITSGGTGKMELSSDALNISEGKMAGFSFGLTPKFRLEGNYQPDEQDWDWDGYLGIEGKVRIGKTWPFIFMAGPVPIPLFLKASFKLSADAMLGITDWTELGPALNGKFGLDPYVRGSAGVGVDSLISASAFVGGGANMELQWPEEPTLEELSIHLNGGFEIYALLWHMEYEALRWDWELLEEAVKRASFPLLDEPKAWMPYPRNYLFRPNYNRFKGGSWGEAEKALLKDRAVARITEVAENIFPYAEPNIQARGGHLYLAWLYDNPERTDLNRTEVVFSRWDGEAWTEPVEIADDGTADFAPEILVFEDGRAMLSWADEARVLPETATFIDSLAGLEISVAQYDPINKHWSNEIQLTSNNYLDHSPHIKGVPNNVFLTWIRNTANDPRGGREKPNEIMYAAWNGNNWTAPQLIATVPYSIIKTAFAYNGEQGIFAYAVDMDEDLTTVEDQEIYVIVYENGRWGSPQRLTDNAVCDTAPQVAFDNNGHSILTWLCGDELVYAIDLNIKGVITTPGFSSAVACFRMAVGDDGRIVLIWPDASLNGSDLWAAFYDPIFQKWGTHQQITFDEDTERQLSVTMYEDAVVAAYEKVEMIPESVTITLVNGKLRTYQIPKPGETDLTVFWYIIGGDLAVEEGSIEISPPNPVIGETATIMAEIMNKGEVVASGFEVGFYQGNPAEGGVLIGTARVDGALVPGETVAVSIDWTVPQVSLPVDIYVVVDPNHTVEDRNRTNNIASTQFIKPDLAAVAVDWGKIGPDKRYVTVEVENKGALTSAPCVVTFRVDSPEGEIIGTKDLGEVAAGGSVDVTLEWDISEWNFRSNYITVYAILDEAGVVNDFDRENNKIAVLVEVIKTIQPDIKANGSGGPITLNQSDTLTITVSLNNNGITDNADWWLAADTPFGLYFYTFSGWVLYTEPAYQHALFYLPTYEVFSTPVSGLPAGTYTLYFGVDTVMDGDITWDSAYYDTVEVTVTD